MLMVAIIQKGKKQNTTEHPTHRGPIPLRNTLGMGKGPKRTLELVNYWLESRPLTDPCPQSLGLDLDWTQSRARPGHFV